MPGRLGNAVRNLDEFFFNQSGYLLLHEPVPNCFIRLESHLAPRVPNGWHPTMIREVALALNLCVRMADVEHYGRQIASELKAQKGGYSAIAISTHLVGHFSACKAVLDASAILLANLYDLKQGKSGGKLTGKEMDFAKGAIWNSLQAEQPEASRRYNRLRKIMDEIIDWRDAALHRAAPLVVTKLGRDPQTNICHIIGYEMADEPEPDPVKVFSHDKSLNWVDPLHFHNKWRPSLLQLCEETCRDIEAVW